MIHFDTFGTLPVVLADIDRNAPALFPSNTEVFLPQIHTLVQDYAAQNNWDYLAVSLSQGMARLQLEDFLESPVVHDGQIIVDPEASTPDHKSFTSRLYARINKERLVTQNETSGDIMVLVYGLDKLDRNVELQLISSRFKMAEGMLSVLEENSAKHGLERQREFAAAQTSKIREAQERLKKLGRMQGDNTSMEHIKASETMLNQEILVLLATTYAMMDGVNDEGEVRTLRSLEHMLRSAPQQLRGLGGHTHYIKDALMNIQKNERQEQAVPRAPDIRDRNGDGIIDAYEKRGLTPPANKPN